MIRITAGDLQYEVDPTPAELLAEAKALLPRVEKMTDRQRAAWSDAIADLRRHAEVPDDAYHWQFSWQEESRPGRGQMFTATWADGEHFAQIVMDVYGYPATSIAETDWLHSSSDEECGCAPCERARRDAEKWDEGYGLGIEVGHRGDDYWESNPYRIERTAQR